MVNKISLVLLLIHDIFEIFLFNHCVFLSKLKEAFQELRHKAGPEIADEEIWEAVVGGEERGRLFGLGKRSRINVKRAVQVVLEEEEEACPTKNSTATTATSHAVFTREELDKIVSEKLAAQEAAYNEKIGQLQQVNDYNKICIDRLLQAAGLNPPHLDVICSTLYLDHPLICSLML